MMEGQINDQKEEGLSPVWVNKTIFYFSKYDSYFIFQRIIEKLNCQVGTIKRLNQGF